jgi:hypothetical protein
MISEDELLCPCNLSGCDPLSEENSKEVCATSEAIYGRTDAMVMAEHYLYE